MAILRTAPPSLLAVLALAALASCGEPVGALPSHVLFGEVAVFKAAAPGVGAPKSRDAARSLPSNLSAGQSAVYRPPALAGPLADPAAGEATASPGPKVAE